MPQKKLYFDERFKNKAVNIPTIQFSEASRHSVIFTLADWLGLSGAAHKLRLTVDVAAVELTLPIFGIEETPLGSI